MAEWLNCSQVSQSYYLVRYIGISSNIHVGLTRSELVVQTVCLSYDDYYTVRMLKYCPVDSNGLMTKGSD